MDSNHADPGITRTENIHFKRLLNIQQKPKVSIEKLDLLANIAQERRTASF